MNFCEKCGEVLIIQDGVYTCQKCGYKETIADSSYTVKREQTDIKTVYVQKDKEEATTIKVSCPRCNNDRATVENVSTGMGVSIMVQKYTCTECKHSWR